MLKSVVVSCALLALPAVVYAQTGYSVSGGLSNFDCGNHCDDPCDEFEIEIEGVHPEDVMGTWRNSNYGSPVVVLSADGSFTVIDYRNPQHLTTVNSIEHFGVTLRSLSSSNTIRVKWMRNGAPATVNGQVPVSGGGTAPATQPLLPAIFTDLGSGVVNPDGMTLSVTNNDAFQAIWVKRSSQVYAGTLSLGQLMPNDPAVTSTISMDNAPVYVGPGQTISADSDLLAEPEDNQTVVFVAEYFQDLFSGGPFGSTHIVGPSLGKVMTASIASTAGACENSAPVIIHAPQNKNAAAGREVSLTVDADGNDMPLSYQWIKDGQDIPVSNGGLFRNVNSDGLDIVSLGAATEGFYACRVSNACGTTVTASAMVYITGHNIAATPIGVTADPATQVLYVGDTAIFMGSAAFIPPGTTYQWFHNGVAITDGVGGASAGGGEVLGSSGPADTIPFTLIIAGVQSSDAGSYTLTLNDFGKTASSSPSTLGVYLTPCKPLTVTASACLDSTSLLSFLNLYFTNYDGFGSGVPGDDTTIPSLNPNSSIYAVPCAPEQLSFVPPIITEVGLKADYDADCQITPTDLLGFLSDYFNPADSCFAGCFARQPAPTTLPVQAERVKPSVKPGRAASR